MSQLGPIRPIYVTGGKPESLTSDSASQITINSQYITFKVDVGQGDDWTESENVSSVVNVNQIVYGSDQYTPTSADHPISIEFKNSSGHIFTVAEESGIAGTTVDIKVNGTNEHFEIPNPLPNQEWMASEYSDINATFYQVEIKNSSGTLLAKLEGGDASVTIYVEQP